MRDSLYEGQSTVYIRDSLLNSAVSRKNYNVMTGMSSLYHAIMIRLTSHR